MRLFLFVLCMAIGQFSMAGASNLEMDCSSDNLSIKGWVPGMFLAEHDLVIKSDKTEVRYYRESILNPDGPGTIENKNSKVFTVEAFEDKVWTLKLKTENHNRLTMYALPKTLKKRAYRDGNGFLVKFKAKLRYYISEFAETPQEEKLNCSLVFRL